MRSIETFNLEAGDANSENKQEKARPFTNVLPGKFVGQRKRQHQQWRRRTGFPCDERKRQPDADAGNPEQGWRQPPHPVSRHRHVEERDEAADQ